MQDIDNTQDIIDVRDITDRIDELDAIDGPMDGDDIAERAALGTLLDELKGQGGDHQWQGDWYPLTLVSDDYWTDYAKQLAEDLGALDNSAGWPSCHIDWEAAGDSLKMDYASIDYDGVTYWFR